MKNALVLLASLISFASCSSIQQIHSPEQSAHSKKHTSPDNVDLNLNENSQQNSKPSENPTEVVKEEETVRVGDHGGDVFTNPNQAAEASHLDQKKLRIGLNLGPGLYRAINYVSFLKVLERQNISPDIITGTDFGAVVAAMYANGMTPEVIEWNFYKFFKEKKKNKPYEKDWIKEIDEAFLMKFKAINIQDTKKKFFLTLYDHKTKKTYYFDKGNIRDLLLLNFRLSNNITESKSGQKYTTAFEKEVYNARLLKQVGADFTIAADVLGSKFDFDTTNEFLLGVYGRAAGRIKKEVRDFDYTVTLPLTLMNLDSIKDSSMYMQKSFEYMQKQIPNLSKKLQMKNDETFNSGIEQ